MEVQKMTIEEITESLDAAFPYFQKYSADKFLEIPHLQPWGESLVKKKTKGFLLSFSPIVLGHYEILIILKTYILKFTYGMGGELMTIAREDRNTNFLIK